MPTAVEQFQQLLVLFWGQVLRLFPEVHSVGDVLVVFGRRPDGSQVEVGFLQDGDHPIAFAGEAAHLPPDQVDERVARLVTVEFHGA